MAEARTDDAALDNRLQEAARAGDARALAQTYRLVADRAADDGDPDAAGFFLTQAYVWALVAGDDLAALRLEKKLRVQGRLD